MRKPVGSHTTKPISAERLTALRQSWCNQKWSDVTEVWNNNDKNKTKKRYYNASKTSHQLWDKLAWSDDTHNRRTKNQRIIIGIAFLFAGIVIIIAKVVTS